ncbi:hypothetical protein L596_023834 [Steinernema carpocapsae]|uniref:Protein kinase domain-containing protein n=1 Tax=Steinernema carpocapsae TaxID=34508 RepID=A0A4U5MEW7_STECR|nr:hypothetical protein L596_023834 [Steinernema carpocapsae]
MKRHYIPFENGQILYVAGRRIRIVKHIAEDIRMNVYVVTSGEQDLILKEVFDPPDMRTYRQVCSLKGKHLNSGEWELTVQNKLGDHANIVQAIGGHPYAQDPRRFLILMERAPFGDLGQVLQEWSSVEYHTAWSFYDQIVSALGHMHRHHQVHAGVGSRNIFVFSSEVVKVGDFGNGFHDNEKAEMTRGQLEDLIDAAQILLRMLLGRRASPLEDLHFRNIDSEDGAEGFLWEHTLWAERMTAADVWFLRQQLERSYDRPLPWGYNT